MKLGSGWAQKTLFEVLIQQWDEVVAEAIVELGVALCKVVGVAGQKTQCFGWRVLDKDVGEPIEDQQGA